MLVEEFEREGWSGDDLTKLGQYKDKKSLQAVILGHAKIELVCHLIDCSADPYIPGGWTVEEHQKGGTLEWDSAKILLFLAEKQKTGLITGHDLRKELVDKPVLNANVLDYLLAHPELIPEDWKEGEYIFFWGTIYRYSDVGLCVRCLGWGGGRWYWDSHWLLRDWFANYPAACSQVTL